MGTYAGLTADVLAYTQYDETTFVAEIPRFVQAAEERIWFFIQLPYFRRNVTGSFVNGPYLNLPDDFLAAASLAVILATGDYKYLLNKDVNYIREVYPNPTATGEPECYALFDNDNIIVGPTPSTTYAAELHYFYRPATLVSATPSNTTWLSLNAYDTLLYGTLSEAANFMKKSAGIDDMAAEYEKRFLVGLQGLKNLGEARDRKDVYRAGEKRSSES